jgi:hypothetical protein
MTIWIVHIVCWIPKATNPHSEYVLRIAFISQQWLQESPPYYIVCTLPVFVILASDVSCV